MVEDTENKSKISIWWDIENCHVPKDVDPHYIAQNMTAALQHASMTGPIEIQVFGDTMILPHITQKALSDTGITLNHVPRGNKDAADKAILVAMLLWALDNPPPANILLISGDGDFANALHRLRLKTYSILLAIPAQFVKPALTGAAKKLWFWKDMAKGQLAEPELSQPSSNTSSQDLAGSRAMEAFQKRQMSSSFGASATQSSAVSNGYTSPQKKLSTSEHLRSMSLENHRNSYSSHGFSNDNRSRSCGSENANIVASDKMVSPGLVSSTAAFSDNLYANISQCRPPVSAARNVDFGQYPCFLPQVVGRVESLTSITDGSKPPQFTNMPAGPLPRGPLKHIAPNNNRGVNNIPFVRNAVPENNYNQLAVHKNASTEYPNPKGVTPHQPATLSIPLSVVANNAEKLSHSVCLDKVYSAMKTLERDMLAPTDSNLSDCIQYWDSQHERVDVKQTLKTAADSQQITKTQLGGGLIMYFPPEHRVPWNCVDPGNMNFVHSGDVWLELQRFLLYGEKKQAFLSSCSRYKAALIVKNSCGMHFQNLVVGTVLNLLQQAIQERKWLRKTGPGWGPLILNQKALLDWPGGETFKQDWRPSSNPGGPLNVWKPVPSTNADRALEKDAICMKLRSFLAQALKDGTVCNVSLLPKDFELATGTPLDHQKLGFATLKELIGTLSDMVYVETTDSGVSLLRLVKDEGNSTGLVKSTRGEKESDVKASRQTHLVEELKTWLSYRMSNVKDGYDISRVYQDFMHATGKDLSKEGLGPDELNYVLKQLTDVIFITKSPGGLWLAYPANGGADASRKYAGGFTAPTT
ncbi:hypothetical protein GOP47_0006485 [Adiantum capillus-veneris]|uniref:HTH OST-type domain-containing protein n=1 Tax=Adiantum capillus-veneris TaxID=13818 RepID=A0A9D4V3D1_ADICA|nr:hypothetical protein GOP47_0006485 [Adiantum capillus-veneris]